MQAEKGAQLVGGLGGRAEGGEETELDCGLEDLGRPEAHADLQGTLRRESPGGTSDGRAWSLSTPVRLRTMIGRSGLLRPVAGDRERPARIAALEEGHDAFERVRAAHHDVMAGGLALTDLVAGHCTALPQEPLRQRDR